ncbi:MAG: DNA polymerase I [Lachnospiraceae bacterium]|nr:DNA polymerase I [Lachnospiraceae bacterium]
MDKLVLIDGHSIINRAFYGVPDLTNSQGLHTNAIYGFLNIMFKILEEENANNLVVAFDVKHPTFRHEMFGEYKGTRKPMPEELREQVPVLQEVLRAMNITIATLPGYEADDIIGTLAKRAVKDGYNVSVISGDRDLLQLADANIQIRIPKTKRGGTEIENYYPEQVEEEYLVSPMAFIDVKALMGDTSDNIPGVPSVGVKTATKLISTYGSLDKVYENIDEVKPERIKNLLIEYKEQAYLSKKLATINTESPVDVNIKTSTIDAIYSEEAYEWIKKLEFKSMLTKFDVDTKPNEIEQLFKYVSDFNEAENIFSKAIVSTKIGLYPVVEGKMFGVALAIGEEDVYFVATEGFITEGYLTDKIYEIINKVEEVSFIDLKPNLKLINTVYRKNLFDASIAGYLLNPLKDTYNYEDVARDYMSLTVPSKVELLGKSNFEQAIDNNHEAFLKVVCYNAYIAFASVDVLKDKLKEFGMYDLFVNIEMPTLFVLDSMEKYGIKVEREELDEYGKMLGEKVSAIEKNIYLQVGEEFNINSPKQLGEILFEKMGLKGGKKTKTGYSTSADVLEKLAPDYPVIKDILEYRQLTKLKSTYADGLVTYIGEDGRIHGKFNQTITATGRISSTEPNLQNIPIRMEIGKAIRKVFVPEKDYVFIDADYSQIELRVLAHISNDENLINAYRSASDIHRITASKVFNTPMELVTEQQRRNAKAVNFGIVYGISSFGLSQDLSISRKEAGEYIQQYFETYPGIKEFLDDTVKNAKDNGYVATMFGRRRPVPELSSSNFMQRQFGERIAMNSPIQGSAADIIKIAMVNVYNALKERNLKSRLILQVHDELLIEAHKDEVEEVKKIVEDEMINAASLAVVLEIDLNCGGNWLEAH